MMSWRTNLDNTNEKNTTCCLDLEVRLTMTTCGRCVLMHSSEVEDASLALAASGECGYIQVRKERMECRRRRRREGEGAWSAGEEEGG